MAVISTELFDKITGISVNSRDRNMIYATLALCWASIGYLVYVTKDPALHLLIANGMLWLIGLLVIVFVSAGAVRRGQAGGTVKAVVPAAAAPSPVTLNVGAAEAPPAPSTVIEKVKDDTTAIRKKVKA